MGKIRRNLIPGAGNWSGEDRRKRVDRQKWHLADEDGNSLCGSSSPVNTMNPQEVNCPKCKEIIAKRQQLDSILRSGQSSLIGRIPFCDFCGARHSLPTYAFSLLAQEKVKILSLCPVCRDALKNIVNKNF